MNEFYQGVIASISVLGGLCAFNFWVFSLMERRLEDKIEKIALDVSSVVQEMKQERADKTSLYSFVLDAMRKKNEK